MQGSSCPNQIIRFGVFEVDLQEAELRRSGLRQKLNPQAFEVLRAMLERPGELITREELREYLWPGNATVDYELGLKKCINRIREVLGDSADHARFIETVPRRGYRFVAPVQKYQPLDARAVSAAEKMSTAPMHIQNDRVFQAERTGTRAKRVLAAGLLVGVIAIISTWPRRSHGSNPSDHHTVSPPEITVLPLTGIDGQQTLPAFSPDGSRVAFMHKARARNGSGLYAAVVGSQSLLRLTQGDDSYSPAWSPDGREVAFLCDRGDKFLIETIPALGGAEKSIYTGSRSPLDYETGKGGLCFSPDGKLLAFSEWNAATQRSQIKALSLQDSSTRFLTWPPPGCHDRRPDFSTAGDKVAFIRSCGPTALEEIFLISAGGGEAKQLTFDHKQIFGAPAWTRSGEIIFSSSRGGLPAIWRIRSSGDVPSGFRGPVPLPRTLRSRYPAESLRTRKPTKRKTCGASS